MCSLEKFIKVHILGISVFLNVSQPPSPCQKQADRQTFLIETTPRLPHALAFTTSLTDIYLSSSYRILGYLILENYFQSSAIL